MNDLLICPDCEGRGWHPYFDYAVRFVMTDQKAQCLSCYGEGLVTPEELAALRELEAENARKLRGILYERASA